MSGTYSINDIISSNVCIHVTLPGSLARQPCPAAPATQTCSAALLGSLARQPCTAVRPITTGFDARAPQSPHFTTVAGHQTVCVRCCSEY
jgi:hypothetical protein